MSEPDREADIQRQLRALEADPHFRKAQPRADEVTVTFLGPEAAARLRAARERAERGPLTP